MTETSLTAKEIKTAYSIIKKLEDLHYTEQLRDAAKIIKDLLGRELLELEIHNE